jgi:lysophospholipase L1-like esterase
MTTKRAILVATTAAQLLGASVQAEAAGTIVSPENASANSTFRNPLNIEYCFRPDSTTGREAADPLIVPFKGDTYLFASKSSGHGWSPDLLNRNLAPSHDNYDYMGDGERQLNGQPEKDLPVWGHGPSAALVDGAIISGGVLAAEVADITVFKENARILFQGDSITDGNRGRNEDPNHILGHGYCFIIAAKFGAQYPERKLTFMNRGISGNKVTDLSARWQSDTLDLKPDVLSIMIGINDSGKIPLDQYEQVYDKLLGDAEAANPNIHFVLCEPFYLPKDGHKEGDERDQDVKKRQAIVAKLAGKHHAALVKLQQVFDNACKRAPAQYWVWDAVHPTYSGHQLMADEWIKTVSQFHIKRKENKR